MLISRRTPGHNAYVAAGIALVLMLLVTCGTAVDTAPSEPLSGTYIASGGGGALLAVQALTARFEELHPRVEWRVTESGSNSAIKLVISNTVDIGFVSRALTDAEKEQVTGIPIGFSGTAVVLNSANPVTNLSKEQLLQIYSGEAKSWLQLGGIDATIRPFLRESNAATRQTFEAYLFAGSPAAYGRNVVEQMEADVLLTSVRSFSGAIGIASTGSRTAADNRVRIIQVDGVAATKENIASGAYKIVRPLAVIYSNTTPLKPAVRAFLEFVKSAEGQRTAAGAF